MTATLDLLELLNAADRTVPERVREVVPAIARAAEAIADRLDAGGRCLYVGAGAHFGNAMRPLHHRELGPIGWGLLSGDVTVDVIADLKHLAPDMLRLVLKAKGAENVALISDAIPPAGGGDGAYSIWGETLTVKGGAARNATGALAGSVSLLDEGVRNLVALGVPEEQARASASDVPRRVLSRQ